MHNSIHSFIFKIHQIKIGINSDMVNKELLDILACPKCKGTLELNDSSDGLTCKNCKLLYEIRDDIPIMLVDEAKKID